LAETARLKSRNALIRRRVYFNDIRIPVTDKLMFDRMEIDHIDIANKRNLVNFIHKHLPQENWKSWRHPQTNEIYEVTLSTSTDLSDADFQSCFRLIEYTSSADYKMSKDGWKPRSKKKEMRLLDLKYFLVKRDNKVEGFLSFMPTYEDDYPVIYCYEIHLSSALQG
jgi:hypothetical protein